MMVILILFVHNVIILAPLARIILYVTHATHFIFVNLINLLNYVLAWKVILTMHK
jgi:hypothetical protein